MTDKHHSDRKSLNDHFSDIVAKLTDTSSKTYNQEEEFAEIPSKLSTNEDCIKNLKIKETQIQTLSLHIT